MTNMAEGVVSTRVAYSFCPNCGGVNFYLDGRQVNVTRKICDDPAHRKEFERIEAENDEYCHKLGFWG